MKTSVIYHNFPNLYNWQEEWLAGVWELRSSWGPSSLKAALISLDKLNPLVSDLVASMDCSFNFTRQAGSLLF